MGFLAKSGFQTGSPLTIKGNMQEGQFQLLGGKKVGKSISIAMLKVVDLPNVCLFPDKDNLDKKNFYDWRNLMYRNLETGEICSTLIKTFSMGRYDTLIREIALYAKTAGEDLDASDFSIEMVIEDIKVDKSKHQIGFYFCKNKKGENVNYLNEDGQVNKEAIAQKLSGDQYNESAEFHAAHNEDLYDGRLGEEIVANNYPAEAIEKLKLMSSIDQFKFSRFVLFEFGYFSKEYFEKNFAKSSTTMLPA